MPDQLIDYAYEWACKYGLGTEARMAIKVVLDEKDAEIKRLDAAGEKMTYAYEHEVIDSLEHLAKVERLNYVKEENSWLCKQHSEDERDMELLREDMCVLTAEVKLLTTKIQQSGEAGSRERDALASPSPGSASPVELPYTRCVQCGVLVDTREHDTPGAELTGGRWACSRECWDKAADESDTTTHRDGGDAKEPT